MNKTGLILEGGAMRGMFTCGVIDVMMENSIDFDGIIGVSAGAVFGCNYKSRQIGRAIRYNTRYSKDPRYCSIRSLLKTGDLYGADFCYRKLPDELDVFDVEAYRANPTEFHVVCTDVDTGEPYYVRCDLGTGDDLVRMRASASMPLVSRIVEVDGRRLLDGGISDSIPLRKFVEMGYTKNVVVLTRPRGYVKKKSGAMPIIKLALGKYPNLVKTMANRHEMYNTQVNEVFSAEAVGESFVICPETDLPIGRIEKDPAKLREVYEIGRKTAENALAKLRDFLEK